MSKEKISTNIEKEKKVRLEKKDDIPEDKKRSAEAASWVSRSIDKIRKDWKKSAVLGLGIMTAVPGVANNLEDVNKQADREFSSQDKNRPTYVVKGETLQKKRSKAEAEKDYQTKQEEFDDSQIDFQGKEYDNVEWTATSPNGQVVNFKTKAERDAFLREKGYSPEGEYIGVKGNIGENRIANSRNQRPASNIESVRGSEIDKAVRASGERVQFRFPSPDGKRNKDFNSMADLEAFANSVNNPVDNGRILVIRQDGSREVLSSFLSKIGYSGPSQSTTNERVVSNNENIAPRQERGINFSEFLSRIPEGKGDIIQDNGNGTFTTYEVNRKGGSIKIKIKNGGGDYQLMN